MIVSLFNKSYLFALSFFFKLFIYYWKVISKSQPSLFSSLSTITYESISRDSLVIGNLDCSSNFLEADVRPEHVVIYTGESDVSTLLKFVVVSHRSSKSHKT